MENLTLFLNSFMSYLLVFGVAVVLVIVAAFSGIKWRKSKDAKEALVVAETASTESK